MKNLNYDLLVKRRDRVREEICTLMHKKDYYSNPELYKRVKALTGLETFFTYQIEIMDEKAKDIYPEEY
jgi:hypothetical protein